MKITNSKTAAAAHLSASLFSNHLREFVSELRERESEVVMGGLKYSRNLLGGDDRVTKKKDGKDTGSIRYKDKDGRKVNNGKDKDLHKGKDRDKDDTTDHKKQKKAF